MNRPIFPKVYDDLFIYCSSLGHGNYGTVHHVRHKYSHESFAIKVAAPSAEAKQQQRDKAIYYNHEEPKTHMKAFQTKCPYILGIHHYEAGANNTMYSLLELCVGKSLEQIVLENRSFRFELFIKRRPMLPPGFNILSSQHLIELANRYRVAIPYIILDTTTIQLIATQLVLAVNCLSEHRIVHRDIKPANIMILKCKIPINRYGQVILPPTHPLYDRELGRLKKHKNTIHHCLEIHNKHLYHNKQPPIDITQFTQRHYERIIDQCYKQLYSVPAQVIHFPWVKLADFGFSKESLTTKPDHDLFTSMAGSPAYVAEETYGGQGYGRTVDLVSTGITIFELFTLGAPGANHPDAPVSAPVEYPKFRSNLSYQGYYVDYYNFLRKKLHIDMKVPYDYGNLSQALHFKHIIQPHFFEFYQQITSAIPNNRLEAINHPWLNEKLYMVELCTNYCLVQYPAPLCDNLPPPNPQYRPIIHNILSSSSLLAHSMEPDLSTIAEYSIIDITDLSTDEDTLPIHKSSKATAPGDITGISSDPSSSSSSSVAPSHQPQLASDTTDITALETANSRDSHQPHDNATSVNPSDPDDDINYNSSGIYDAYDRVDDVGDGPLSHTFNIQVCNPNNPPHTTTTTSVAGAGADVGAGAGIKDLHPSPQTSDDELYEDVTNQQPLHTQMECDPMGNQSNNTSLVGSLDVGLTTNQSPSQLLPLQENQSQGVLSQQPQEEDEQQQAMPSPSISLQPLPPRHSLPPRVQSHYRTLDYLLILSLSMITNLHHFAYSQITKADHASQTSDHHEHQHDNPQPSQQQSSHQSQFAHHPPPRSLWTGYSIPHTLRCITEGRIPQLCPCVLQPYLRNSVDQQFKRYLREQKHKRALTGASRVKRFSTSSSSSLSSSSIQPLQGVLALLQPYSMDILSGRRIRRHANKDSVFSHKGSHVLRENMSQLLSLLPSENSSQRNVNNTWSRSPTIGSPSPPTTTSTQIATMNLVFRNLFASFNPSKSIYRLSQFTLPSLSGCRILSILLLLLHTLTMMDDFTTHIMKTYHKEIALEEQVRKQCRALKKYQTQLSEKYNKDTEKQPDQLSSVQHSSALDSQRIQLDSVTRVLCEYENFPLPFQAFIVRLRKSCKFIKDICTQGFYNYALASQDALLYAITKYHERQQQRALQKQGRKQSHLSSSPPSSSSSSSLPFPSQHPLSENNSDNHLHNQTNHIPDRPTMKTTKKGRPLSTQCYLQLDNNRIHRIQQHTIKCPCSAQSILFFPKNLVDDHTTNSLRLTNNNTTDKSIVSLYYIDNRPQYIACDTRDIVRTIELLLGCHPSQSSLQGLPTLLPSLTILGHLLVNYRYRSVLYPLLSTAQQQQREKQQQQQSPQHLQQDTISNTSLVGNEPTTLDIRHAINLLQRILPQSQQAYHQNQHPHSTPLPILGLSDPVQGANGLPHMTPSSSSLSSSWLTANTTIVVPFQLYRSSIKHIKSLDSYAATLPSSPSSSPSPTPLSSSLTSLIDNSLCTTDQSQVFKRFLPTLYNPMDGANVDIVHLIDSIDVNSDSKVPITLQPPSSSNHGIHSILSLPLLNRRSDNIYAAGIGAITYLRAPQLSPLSLSASLLMKEQETNTEVIDLVEAYITTLQSHLNKTKHTPE